eukprot:11927-Heterococcus_DN1.PRE.1
MDTISDDDLTIGNAAAGSVSNGTSSHSKSANKRSLSSAMCVNNDTTGSNSKKCASTNASYAVLLIMLNVPITLRRAFKGAATAAMDDDTVAVDYD